MKREKNCIPRLAAMLLCLCLCAALLAGCGKTEKNLWGKTVTAELAHVPAEAFDVEDARLCGFSPDGSKALISYNPETYLYDMNTGKRIYLTPGDAMTEEALRLAARWQLKDLAPEQREQVQAKLDALQGRELVTAALSADWYGEKTGMRAMDLPGADGRWMRVSVHGYGIMMLDCENGKLYGRADSQYEDARGDLLLAVGLYPEGKLTQVNVKTGEETALPDFREGYFQSTAAFLPDGGVVAILMEKELDLERGMSCLLATRSAKGEEQVFDLGRIDFGFAPDDILCLGEDLLLRHERMNFRPAYLVNRADGSIYTLAQRGENIEKFRPETDERGVSVLPAGTEQVFVVDALPDGETVLLQGSDGALYLFRPESGETRLLVRDMEGQWLPNLGTSCFTFNGYDRLWAFVWL